MMENKKTDTGFYGGRVPEGWKVKALGKITKMLSGGTPNKENLDFWNGRIPWFSAKDLKSFQLFTSEDYLSDIGAQKGSKLVPKDTILILVRGMMLNRDVPIGIVNSTSAFNQDVKALIPSNNLESYYLAYFLVYQKNRILGLVNRSSHGTGKIETSELSNIPILLPPLPEQRAIAACLSTWDSAIQKTTQLIAQKERRKKWLMQQLLTGKSRLKGFEGEWRECHVREIAKEVSVRNKGDKDLIVLSCTKYDGLVPSLEYFGRRVFSEDTSTYKVVPQNHFAYATNHIEEGSIGYQNDYGEALISPMYTVFKTNKSVNDYFFFKLLKSHRLIHEYNARMEGSIDRRGGLRWEAFSSIKVRIPSFEEQTAIARILQTADQEIQLLKAQVEKMKEQKKGMMQVLLTGRIRLKI